MQSDSAISSSILLVCACRRKQRGTGTEVRAFYLMRTVEDACDTVKIVEPLAVDCVAEKCGSEPSSPISDAPHASRPLWFARLLGWYNVLLRLALPASNDWQSYLQLCMHFCGNSQHRGRRRLFGWMLLAHQWLLSLFVDVPPQSLCWVFSRFQGAATDAIRSALSEPGKFDLIWCETTPAFAIIRKYIRASSAPRPRIVLSAHNVEWLIPHRLAAGTVDLLVRWNLKLQSRLMRRLERDAHAQCDVVIHCSDDDVRLARDLHGRARLACVGNGVDIQYYRPIQGASAPVPTVIYTGTFGYQPNLEAADVLVRDLLPLLQRSIPGVRLVLAGRDASALLNRFPTLGANVEFVSDPSDMRPLFRQAWLTIVPLRSGGGTRLKILEAMAMKVPVISTRIGAEGLNAVDGEVLLIRDEPAAMAAAAIDLLNDATAREAIAERAAAWVRKHYSWNHLEQLAEQELRKLLASR